MRIQALILAVLVGCDTDSRESTGDDTDVTDTDSIPDTGCEPFIDEVHVDVTLDQAELEAIMKQYGASAVTDLTCPQVCMSQLDYGFYEDEIIACSLTIDETDPMSGVIDCTAEQLYPCGRRPQGHIAEDGGDCAVDLGGFLAHCAHMEAASVFAFSELARQLTDLGAPEALITRCHQAAAEEEEHAEVMGALAARHGHAAEEVRREPVVDDLETIATHNAREGCVAETWAALVCARQARSAHDPALREALSTIASDELRHAQLAWDLHVWMLSRLDQPARIRVEAARIQALGDLPAQATMHAAWIPADLGMPAPEQCVALAARLSRGLLAA